MYLILNLEFIKKTTTKQKTKKNQQQTNHSNTFMNNANKSKYLQIC